MKPISYLAAWAHPYYGNVRFDLASSGVPDTLAVVPEPARGSAWDAVNGLDAIAQARARVASMYGAPESGAILTFGGTQALFMTAFVAAQQRLPVVVESPTYEPLYRNFEALGCEVRFLERPREERYSVRSLCDEAASRARGAACLVMTNPNNPSGAYDEPATLGALARAIEPAWLIVNETYLPFVPDGATAYGSAPNVCVMGTLTKAYGISIPRFGWIVAPEPLAGALRDAVFYLHGRYSGTVAALALPVLENLEGCLAAATRHLAGRHDLVDRTFAGSKRVRWLRPAGKVTIALATVEGVADDLAFARALLAEHGVITAPGRYFRAPGAVRISLGAAADQFDGGPARFLDFAERYGEDGERLDHQ